MTRRLYAVVTKRLGLLCVDLTMTVADEPTAALAVYATKRAAREKIRGLVAARRANGSTRPSAWKIATFELVP